ncbi:hypothetical protein KC340_g1216 [Hortaea werneckii]|nr:hypothetical protein KC342_g2168 [Hortaea werneckii]KAI7106886.1 hypothetical protein KC339_g2786 [Hortaea werneckii]KAI7218659.1 hypothetical protein KC365_g12555 [Hortaea werneckii]KAI7337681.1 hypothetical protein KC340_g1216 [Hortaea werneckii]
MAFTQSHKRRRYSLPSSRPTGLLTPQASEDSSIDLPSPKRARKESAIPSPSPKILYESPTGNPKSEEPTEPPSCPSTLLTRATHVLATEAAALSSLATLYSTSPGAQTSLAQTCQLTLHAHRTGGRLIACGVGKSAYIAQKLVATCKSLSIRASFLHACEAVHGDLGDVTERDVVVFVSFSGKTAELVNLLPHFPPGCKVVALTGQTDAKDCRLLDGRREGEVEGEGEATGVLLPGPIPEKEEESFGVGAPTTSTTVALAVADMLALTLAEELHRGKTGETFKRNHPGGAIGAQTLLEGSEPKKQSRRQDRLVEPELCTPPASLSGSDDG